MAEAGVPSYEAVNWSGIVRGAAADIDNRSLLVKTAAVLVALTTLAAAPRAGISDPPVRLIIPFPPGGSNDIVGRADRDTSWASGSASRSSSTTAPAPAA